MGDGATCDQGQCSSLGSFMPSGYKTEIENAFDAWGAVADLTFTEVADDNANWGATTTSGDIRLAGHPFDGPGSTLAHAYYPTGGSAAGDVHFDRQENWTLDTSGFSIFLVGLHEIGHGLGLGHSDDPNSIMYSYYNDSLAGLTQDDIDGIQALYGATAVPEPQTWALFLLGLAAVLIARRRSTAMPIAV